MLLSYNWLQEFGDFKKSPEELDATMTMLGIEVESIENYADKYKGFFIGEVLTREKHPKADKLSLCTVSIGGDDIKNIVCGAPNVDAGQKVVLGVLGAVVPSAGFKLERRKIRDYESEGMICSLPELELGEDTGGIWVLPENAPVGTPLADYLNMNDIIFELGLTPNKADCLSHIGIARELAAQSKQIVKMPEFELKESSIDVNSLVKVEINDTDKCPRYAARVIQNAKISESPAWLKTRLKMIGLRPINCVVDAANLVLMECGHPLHTFDLDKINGKKIVVRTASDNEKITTLDGKERLLDSNMLMICDEDKPIAAAGVMGGLNSEISNQTTNILIESAYFNPSSVRKTAKKLGINSDASYRFERGADIENVEYALNRLAALTAELTDGEIACGMIDVYPKTIECIELDLRFEKARKIIGIELENEEMISILTHLGFELISSDETSMKVKVPHRRNDVTYEIDLIEEIARLYNYNNIEPDYTSSIDFSGKGMHQKLAVPTMREKIRIYFAQSSYNEILTQNMTDPASAAIFTDNPVKIANPLGEELSILKPSMVPSLMKVINHNIRMGNHNLAIFELGKIFVRPENGVETFIKNIEERDFLAVALCGKSAPRQWGTAERSVDFFDLKGAVAGLFEYFRYDNLKFKASDGEDEVFSKNAADIYIKKTKIGKIGEVKAQLLKHYDIESKLYFALIDLKVFYSISIPNPVFSAPPQVPGSSRDFAFIVNQSIQAEDIKKEITAAGGKFLKSVEVFDVFAGKSIGENMKSIAFSVKFSAGDRTLVESEIESAANAVVSSVEKKFGAVLRK